MSWVERKTVYFETPGKQNTGFLLKLVKEYAQAHGIMYVVVASTTGETGVKASKIFKGFDVVVVTSVNKAREFKEKNRDEILKNEARILTATPRLRSVERAFRRKWKAYALWLFGFEPFALFAHALSLLGAGTKVCVEIALMAADAGLIPVDREVVAIAGTGRGADTALLIKPATASHFFKLEVKEVIAKPRNLRLWAAQT